MNYSELLNIINKVWLDKSDISKITNCGKDSATKIRNQVTNNIIKKGYTLPQDKTKIVPTQEVLDYLGLDIHYIIEMATLEQQYARDYTINGTISR